MKAVAARWLNASKTCKNPVCKIEKALYGLRQSGLKWYQKLTTKLLKLNLKPSQYDPCLFMNREDDNIILVTVYVDDLLIATYNKSWLTQIKVSLSESFEMKDLGPVKTCLGIEFKQNIKQHTVFLHQREFIKTVFYRFNITDCKPVRSPMATNCKLQRQMKI